MERTWSPMPSLVLPHHSGACCERRMRRITDRWGDRPLDDEDSQRDLGWGALEFDPATGR